MANISRRAMLIRMGPIFAGSQQMKGRSVAIHPKLASGISRRCVRHTQVKA
jgi:hypothetical protein